MKKINILYSMICREFHNLVIRDIRKNLNIGNELAITELHKETLRGFCNTYECCDAYYGQYYKYKEYFKCPAVDDNIIDKMNPYAMEIIKMMDRKQSWDMPFEDRMHLYFEHIKFWNYVLDYYDINRVVFLNIPHEGFDYVIYCLCKIKSIKMTIFRSADPFGMQRVFVCDDINEPEKKIRKIIEKYKEEYRECSIDDIELMKGCQRVYENFVKVANEKNTDKAVNLRTWKGGSSKEHIEYMAYMDVRHAIEKKYKKRTDSKMVSQELARRLEGEKSFFYKKPYEIIGYIRTKQIWDYYECLANIPPKGEKYILFCMHYQPEATTSPGAGGIYSNQLIAIDILATNLPKGVMLYVKEHPNQAYVGKTKSLYYRIAQKKNVRLISNRCNQYELIRGCIATASLTGTVAIESVMMNKPCILFGKIHYNHLEGVIALRDNEACRETIRKIVEGDICIDQRNIKLFFKAIYESSYAANRGYGGYSILKNSIDISELIIRHIRGDIMWKIEE